MHKGGEKGMSTNAMAQAGVGQKRYLIHKYW
jgi:hypothetical protein